MKKSLRKRVIQVLDFVVIGVLLFLYFQNVLEKKWYYPSDTENQANAIHQYQSFEKEKIDVVFLGTSHMKMGISPIRAYEKNHVAAYNLASTAQPLAVSYYLLKESYKKQTPSVVVLDVSGLFSQATAGDYSWHAVLDNMPFNRNKLLCQLEYVKSKKDDSEFNMVDVEKMLPFCYYHDRWSELGKNDFSINRPQKSYCMAGYNLFSTAVPTGMSADAVEGEINYLETMQDTLGGYTESYKDGVKMEKKIENKLYNPKLNAKTWEYVEKIKALCDENGSNLLLTKIPSVYLPQIYEGTWSLQKSNIIKEMASKCNIDFWDLTYDTDDVGLDWEVDTMDAGRHLNLKGAEKVTDTLMAYIMDKYCLQQKNNEEYEAFLEDYNKICKTAYLQMETDFKDYLGMLEDENYEVFISVSEDFWTCLREEDIQMLRGAGFQTDFSNAQRYAFLGVISGGNVGYEALSNRRISYEYRVENGAQVEIVSSGLNTGAESSIMIDGIEYSLNMRGLNIVVYDKESKLVIDSVNFDTSGGYAKAAYRNDAGTINYINEYQNYIFSQTN